MILFNGQAINLNLSRPQHTETSGDNVCDGSQGILTKQVILKEPPGGPPPSVLKNVFSVSLLDKKQKQAPLQLTVTYIESQSFGIGIALKKMWITHSGLLRRDNKTAGNESLGAKERSQRSKLGILVLSKS